MPDSRQRRGKCINGCKTEENNHHRSQTHIRDSLVADEFETHLYVNCGYGNDYQRIYIDASNRGEGYIIFVEILLIQEDMGNEGLHHHRLLLFIGPVAIWTHPTGVIFGNRIRFFDVLVFPDGYIYLFLFFFF